MRFSVSSLITLLAAVGAVTAQPAKRARSINPVGQNARVDLAALPPVDVTPNTNARRFSLGLPPLNPVKRHPHRGGPHRDGGYSHKGTPVGLAPRAEASPSPPTNFKCNILVKTSAGSPLGYISPVFNDYGEYGILQTSQAGALGVSFPNTGPVDFLTTNNVDTINSFPFLSAALGFLSHGDDLGPGSTNYITITGNSGSTGSGSTPASSTANSYTTRTGQTANSETAIWTYDPATQAIHIVWTNTDGSSVPTKLAYFIDTDPTDADSNTFVATGDMAAFQGSFGCTDTCPEITFTCVPPA